jgi:hypothetical protein
MKHGEADRTLQGKEIKCKKNANNLLLAAFFEAFIGGVSSAHGEEKVKKVSLRRGGVHKNSGYGRPLPLFSKPNFEI